MPRPTGTGCRLPAWGPSSVLSSSPATWARRSATHRDRLQVAGLGAELGPVVVSGHVGQAVCEHTLNVYGGSLRVKGFSVRAFYLDHEKATRKMYLQAGFQLPLKTMGG